MDPMRFKELIVVWVPVELKFCASFPTSLLKLGKIEHLEIGHQFAFTFSCEREQGTMEEKT